MDVDDHVATATGYIDSHVHWWDRSVLTYDWLDREPELPARRLAADLARATSDEPSTLGPLSGVVVVEAGRRWSEAEAEVSWVTGAAEPAVPVLGVVAAARIELPDAADQLARLSRLTGVVGVRRLLQDEPAGFTSSPEVVRGARLVGEHGLPFDVCVRDHQLDEVLSLVRACPETTFVLDHLGKPFTGAAPDRDWLDRVGRLAEVPGVVCKLSGLATESGAAGLDPDILVDFLRAAISAFGPQRCMFGSDWPVSAARIEHRAWRSCVERAVDGLSEADRRAVARGTAEQTYGLPVPAPVPATTTGGIHP